MSQPPYPPDQQPQGGYPPPGQSPVQADQPPPAPPGGAYPPPPGAAPYQQVGEPFGAPPKKKSKALKIILIVLAVLVVLCAGTVTAIYFAVRDKVGEAIGNAADSSKITVVTPDKLGERPKVNSPEMNALSDQIGTEFKKNVPTAKSTVGAIYGDPAKQDMVIVIGAATVVLNQDKSLSDLLSGMEVKSATDVDPGPLGGKAKCGNADAEGIQLGVCAWADGGSVAAIAMLFKSADVFQADFVAMRGQIEQKS